MEHETYCQLRLALEKLDKLEVNLRDMPYILCTVEGIRANITQALTLENALNDKDYKWER